MTICNNCGHDTPSPEYECAGCGWELGFSTHSDDEPLPSVASLRALRGRPLPTAHSLRVSGLRWSRAYDYHVLVSGHQRSYFMARLGNPSPSWERWHSTIEPGIVVLAGPDFRESAEAAKAYFESFVYDVSDDPEFKDCDVILNDVNNWWHGEKG